MCPIPMKVGTSSAYVFQIVQAETRFYAINLNFFESKMPLILRGLNSQKFIRILTKNQQKKGF